MAEDNWDDKIWSTGPGPADNAAEADNTVESVTPAAENASLRDRLLRSLADAENTRRWAALLDGVRATQRLRLATLNRFGVRKIDALGAPFDPALHEAIIEVEDEPRPPRSVVSVLEDGYTIHDRLLRAARVAVAKPRPSPDAEGAAAPEAGQVA
jgi:molecular chaperone GrpE